MTTAKYEITSFNCTFLTVEKLAVVTLSRHTPELKQDAMATRDKQGLLLSSSLSLLMSAEVFQRINPCQQDATVEHKEEKEIVFKAEHLHYTQKKIK